MKLTIKQSRTEETSNKLPRHQLVLMNAPSMQNAARQPLSPEPCLSAARTHQEQPRSAHGVQESKRPGEQETY